MKSMGGKYLKAYDTLIPNAYKADLFRYSVVYHYGGCYMDAGSIGIKPLA
jgi:mannosyltransferase OCH1-like enzyme